MTFLKAKKQGFYNGVFVDKDETFELNEDLGKPKWAEETDSEPEVAKRRDSDFRKLANAAAQANNIGVNVPVFRGDELPANHPQIGVSASDPVEAALDQQGIVVKPGEGHSEGPLPERSVEEHKLGEHVAKVEPKAEPAKVEPVKVSKPDQKQAKPVKVNKAKDDGNDLLG